MSWEEIKIALNYWVIGFVIGYFWYPLWELGKKIVSEARKLNKSGDNHVGNLAEYFAQNRYKATWNIGDRVHGKWNKIPFVGTVGNDTLINEREGPRVSVHLDLPIKYNGTVTQLIFVGRKELKAWK